MNKDAEAINQFLAWLLQEPDPAPSLPNVPSGETSSPIRGTEKGVEKSGEVGLQPHIDPLDSEVEAMQADLSESSAILIKDVSFLELGEIPAVQDRFHAIIKRRLRAEIERNPPLFPWETRLWDYETEQPMLGEGASLSFWSAQLQALKLPVPMPESLLLQIFSECRKVAHSSLRQGVKLVRAVENLFPEELPALNHWAGQVLLEPARSASQTLPNTLPQSYEQASSTQQMVLSLLAAQQVLEAMTLEVSMQHPQTQRQWLTASGTLQLEVVYRADADRLRVQAQMPEAGQLTLNGLSDQATATGSEAGTLSVEIGNLVVGQTYPLEVEISSEPVPLIFAVQLTED